MLASCPLVDWVVLVAAILLVFRVLVNTVVVLVEWVVVSVESSSPC